MNIFRLLFLLALASASIDEIRRRKFFEKHHPLRRSRKSKKVEIFDDLSYKLEFYLKTQARFGWFDQSQMNHFFHTYVNF